MTATTLPILTAKDFASDQDVRWCPGCGDYAILNVMRRVLAKIGATKHNTVFVSGIGCSSRFPYYMETYGFHSIHGRAPAIATGVKLANPGLEVWLVTGDGDGLSIGGGHIIHALRRNVGFKVLLFNNRIYGLTKGQYSPTSETGKKTKSSPMGTIEIPLSPLSLALGSEATFVARSIDIDKDLGAVLERAAAHQGTAFVEIYQDCNIFNHKAFEFATDKDRKEDHLLRLEHGKPMVFGKARDQCLVMRSQRLAVARVADVKPEEIVAADQTNASLAFMLSRCRYPDFPEPLGVLYCNDHARYEDLLTEQVSAAQQAKGAGTLAELLDAPDAYVVD